jgi:hypothetical protein
MGTIITVYAVVGVATDVYIAVAMCCLLLRANKSEFQRFASSSQLESAAE